MQGEGAVLRLEHSFLQLLAGLEVGDLLGGDIDGFAGLGIPSDPSLAVDDMERSESPDLDPVAVLEAFGDRLYDDLDRFSGIRIG